MNRVHHTAKSYLAIGLVVFWLALSGPIQLFAHSGALVGAPTKVSGTIVIDGTIDSAGAEAVWAPGVAVDTLPNSCAEFIGVPPAPDVTLFALNDGINLFLALDIPDSSANANDALFLFFDPNHGGGTAPAADDRAVRLVFNNIAANNSVPTASTFTGTGTTWSGPVVGLPAGAEVKYTRNPAGTGKWQVEMKFPFTGPTVGFALAYLNETGTAVGDCDGDGQDDDFYATFPSTLTLAATANLPTDIANPTLWGNLDFGPQPPTVSFLPPLCCLSSDITFVPSAQPFTAGVPVNISASVHNLHTTSTANNVNVEIRVHNFGTGGGVIAPFPLQTTISAINPLSAASGSVNWPSPPAGLHGCIRAEIKPPTLSQYFIAAGNGTAQHNTDVACVPQGGRKDLKFATFNPDDKNELRIVLAKQVLLPAGFEGLKFEVQQPDRPLKAQEEIQVGLTVTAAANVPLTQLPSQKAHVPPTAGGTAVPPLRERTGTAPIPLAVNPGDILHLTASGEVDVDGTGPLPSAGPDGKDVSTAANERQMLLSGPSTSKFGGALIGSFDAFKTSFLIGAESTLTVPGGAKELLLAVNDFDQGFGDNTGTGFEITSSTVLAAEPPVVIEIAKGATPATPAPRAAAAQLTLPQINIAASSAAKVTTGDNITYNLLTNHGGLTYKLLVIAGEPGHGGGGEGEPPIFSNKVIYILLGLLALLLLFFIGRKISRKA